MNMDNLFKSGVGKQYQMYMDITGKIGRRLHDGQETCKAIIYGFLDYMTEQVLETDCSALLVDDMGYLLDLYEEHCNQSKQDKDIFYTNIIVNFMTCFEELNEYESKIVLGMSDPFLQKGSIERLENDISFTPSNNNKENMIVLFNYINKEFVKSKDHGNTKYKK